MGIIYGAILLMGMCVPEVWLEQRYPFGAPLGVRLVSYLASAAIAAVLLIPLYLTGEVS